MPGIDKSRFINFVDNEDEWLCGICLAVFVSPMVTQCCQQTFCNGCIKQWVAIQKTCPNCRERITCKKLSPTPRIVKNLLNKFKMKCEYNDKGCDEELCYDRYVDHIERCKFNPDGICINCGEKNGQRSEHNCVAILLAKYPILQSFTLNIKDLNDIINAMRGENELIKKNLNKLSFTNITHLKWSKIELDVNLKDLQKQVIKGNILTIDKSFWNIEASLTNYSGYDYLSFFLISFSNDADWSCIASVKMSIHRKSEVKKINENHSLFSRVYSNKFNKWGYRYFTLYSSFENEHDEYIFENCIKLCVHLCIW